MTNTGQASLNNAIYLVVLQVGSRLCTFATNQVLLRVASPETFGIVAIQFDLLLNTALFLSREGLRNAAGRLQGLPKDPLARSKCLVTFWIPFLFGLPLTILLGSVYWTFASHEAKAKPGFAVAVAIYIAASICELLSEPYFILSQVRQDYKLRARVEGNAIILKALATLSFIYFMPTLIAFACGQFMYGLTLLLFFHRQYRSQHLLVQPEANVKAYDGQLASLAFAFTKQSIVKQGLTEGDKLVVGRISSLSDQGGYAVALNYGSLVARILFQPVEESSRLYFARLGSIDDTSSRHSMRSLLHDIVHAQLLLGLILFFVCPPYVPTLVRLVLGSKWAATSAPVILQAYCRFIPLLGINGITEAFVQAVATERQIARLSRAMWLWTAVYLIACYVLVSGLGQHETGLIYANMVNMMCRIVYSTRFIQSYFGKAELANSLPMWPTVLVVPLIGLFGQRLVSEDITSRREDIETLAKGGVLGIASLLVIIAFEWRWINNLRGSHRQQS